MTFANIVVVGVKQEVKIRVKLLVVRVKGFKDKLLKEPSGMRQVPLGGAGIRHGLHNHVFGFKAPGQLLAMLAALHKALCKVAACFGFF